MEDLLKSLEQRIEDIQTKAYSDIRKTYGLDEKGKSTGQVIDTKKAQEATKRLTSNGAQANDVIDMLNAQREQQISNMKKSTETLKTSRQGQNNKNKKKIAVNDAKNQQLEQQGIDYINQQADIAIEMIKQVENFQGSVDEQRKAYEFIYQALTQKAQERGQELIDRVKRLQEKKSGFAPIDTSKEEAKLAIAVQKMAVDVGLSLNAGINNNGTKKPAISKAVKGRTIKPFISTASSQRQKSYSRLYETDLRQRVQDIITENAKSIFAYDTETTGKDAKTAKAVTFGVAGFDKLGKEIKKSFFLDSGSSTQNKKNLIDAMNLRDDKGVLIDSAKILRQQLGVIKKENEKVLNSDTFSMPEFVSPDELMRYLSDIGVDTNARSNLLTYNGINYDSKVMKNYFSTYAKNMEEVARKAKTESERNLAAQKAASAKGYIELFEKQAEVADNDVMVAFTDLMTSLGAPLGVLDDKKELISRVRGSSKLQTLVKVMSGDSSDEAHEAGDDAMSTVKAALEIRYGETFRELAKAIKENVDKVGGWTTSDNKNLNPEVQAAILNTIESYTGLGNKDFDASKIDQKVAKTQGYREQVKKVISQFSEGQQSSLTGSELRARMKNRVGLDVSNITGAGDKGYGTSEDAIVQFMQVAEEKGLEVYPRRNGDNLELLLLPKGSKYDSKEWNKDNIKVSFAVGDGTGRIAGGKINQAEVSTSWLQTGKLKEDGTPEVRGVKVLKTSETLAIEDATTALKNMDFANKSKDEISHRLQSASNRAINKVASITMGNEARDDLMDSNTRYSGKLTEIESIRSTQYSINREIASTLNNENVKSALAQYYTGVGQDWKANYDAYDPRKELTDAMANAWMLSMRENLDPQTISDELVKFIMSSDAFVYFRKTAKQIGAAMPSDFTGISEGKLALGKIGTSSSQGLTPYGRGSDMTQRSLTQYYDTLRLTEEALKARSEDKSSKLVTTTQQALNSGIDKTDTSHKRYMGATLTQEQFDEAARMYYKEAGMSDNEIETMLKDMTDVALVTEKIIRETESLQRNVSKTTDTDSMSLDFLAQFGIDVEDLVSNDYQSGSVVDINQKLSNGQLQMFSKDFKVNEGDIVVGLEKVDNGWKLLVDRIRQVEQGTKLVDEGGRRMTANVEQRNGVRLADYVKKYWAAKGNTSISNADYLTIANSELKERNYYPEFMGQINAIIEKAVEAGSSIENIYNNLPPILQKFFEIQTVKDENGNEQKLLVDTTYFDEKTSTVRSHSGEDIFVDPEETKASLLGIEKSALAIFRGVTNNAQEAQAMYDSIKGLSSLGVGQHNVSSYPEASGFGSADTLERAGRVTDDWKVRNARQRSLDNIISAAGKSNVKDKEKVLAGLESLKEQQTKQDNTYGQKGLAAQKARKNLIAANKSLTGREDYTTQQGTKDVEFVNQNGQLVLKAGEEVYSDILTDINALRKSGKISAEAYKDFAMERARQLQADLAKVDSDYERGNIVLNLSDSNIGGKKYLLGDVGAAQSPDGEYYSGVIDSANAALLQAATKSQEAFDEARTRAANVYHDIANNKDSELVKQATHNFVPNSAFSVLSGTSKLANLTPEQANTVYMSSKRIKEMYSSAEGATKEDRRENVNRLFAQLKAKSFSESGQRVIKSLSLDNSYNTEKGEFSGNLTDTELSEIEEIIIGAIIGEIKSGNNKFSAEIGRYPYTQGAEGYRARIGIDEQAGETIRVSGGFANMLRGDYDGDKPRISMVVPEKFGENEAAAEEFILAYYDRFAAIMNDMNKTATKIQDKDKDVGVLAQQLSQKWINKDASIQAKMAFENVGLFSNADTNIRESMYKTGFADNNGAARKVYSGIIRATMESIEQEAISSKKIYARLMNKGISEDDSILEVNKLMEAIHTGRYGDSDKDGQGFLSLAKDFGILNTENFGKQFQTVVAQLVAGNEQDVIDQISKMGIGDFDDKGNFNFKGANMSQIMEAFTAFDAFIKPTGANMSDAVTFSKNIDKYYKANGEARADATYKSNGGGGNSPKNPPADNNRRMTVDSAGNVVVNTSGGVVVNGAQVTVNGSVNGVTASQGTGNAPVDNGIDKAANLRDAGGEWAKFIAADVVSELGEGHSRTMKVGDKTYSSEGGNLRSVTQVTTAPYEDYSKFPNTTQSGNRASALGTFAHAIVENIDNMTDELMEQLIDEVRKSPQLGGAGLSVTAEDLQRQQGRAKDVVNAARTSGAMNDSTLKELKLGGVIGNRAFAGTADALTFGQKVNGKYADVTVADWKFSNSGGEDDPRMRAARVLQASTYLRMAESEYSQVVEKLKQAQSEGKSFDSLSSDLKNRVAELGFEGFDKDTGAGDISAIIEDGEARVEAFARSFVQIIRSFTKDGQSFVETTKGKAASMATVAEGLERGSKGQGIQQDKILAETNFTTTGYYQDGKEINRPQFITDRINRNTGIQTSQGNKDIKDYINNLKQQMKLQEELQRTDLKVNNSSGYEKLEQQNIRTALSEQLTLLKQQGAVYAERVKELKEMGYSQEAINKLEQQEANLQAQHQVKLTKINATYREQKGVLKTIGKTFTNSFARLVSIDVIANQLAMTVRNMFNQIMNSAKSLNAVMVDLQIASGYSYKEIQSMMLDFNTLARKVGKSTEEVATAANDWLRAGYEGQEASQLVENSMNLSVLGMIDSAKATEYLISVLKGWKLSVDEVGEVVDKLTVTKCSVCQVIGIGHKPKSR